MSEQATRTATMRLGTRASQLATTQTEWVAAALRASGHDVELVTVRTEGDINRQPLTQIGGTGVFVSALREALMAGSIDVAVHSLKDLPVAAEPGLALAAVPTREDPRDALISRENLSLEELPTGARVGTGSPRRAAQLRLARPDLDIRELRGNVGTRIGKVTDGELDAVVLAAAGLRRLGREGEVSQWLEPEVMLPAPGQGALALECREGDDDVRAILAELDDVATRRAVVAERSFLGALEAGCTAPIGALATPDRQRPGELTLRGFADLPRGHLRRAGHGPDAQQVGASLAEEFLAAGLTRTTDLTTASTDTPERDS